MGRKIAVRKKKAMIPVNSVVSRGNHNSLGYRNVTLMDAVNICQLWLSFEVMSLSGFVF